MRARSLWIVRLIPWVIAAAIVVIFVFTRWPLSGTRTLSFSFDGTSPWFDAFLPAERVIQPKTWETGWTGQRILRDPVYASLRTPGVYERVRLMIEARFWKQPLMELGMLRDPQTFSFEMVPVWSEALSRGWRAVSYGSLRGYVREDLPDATLATADIDHVLVWHATTTPIRAMDQATTKKTYDLSLRGGHDLYLIPVSGEVHVTIAYQDMNRTQGQNTVALRLSRESETLWTNTLQTGGAQDKKPTDVFETTVRVPDLPPGVYRLSIVAGDDIFLRRITTNAVHWVIGPRLYLGDAVGYEKPYQSIPIWTNSQHIALDTFHREGLQTVTLGTASVELKKTHQHYPLDRLPQERDKMQSLVAPRGDVRLLGDGFFALSPEALFLPIPRRLTDASDPLGEGIQAVVTPYVQPTRTEDGWWQVVLDTRLHPNDTRPKIALAAPGMLARGGWIDIREAELTYRRQVTNTFEWARAIVRELRTAWKRL